MKQKVVIRLPMNDDKSRSKALKTVVRVSKECLESASITGAEKNQVEVVGEGIDAVVLMRALRKHGAGADLVSVAQDKKSEEEKNEPWVPQPVVWCNPYYNGPHYLVVEEPSRDSCTMM